VTSVRDIRLRLDRVAVWDLTIALLSLAVAVGVHLSGSEAVSRNLEPSAFSVLLTTLAVGPLVVRHRYPLTVLALTLSGLLLLVATRNTVGAATFGCTIALYTVVAVAPRRRAVLGVALMVVAVALGLAMRPVDLSSGGSVVTLVIFTGAAVLGYTVRERRESFEAEMVAAQERAARSAADERARITRELHDIIGHAMSVMVVQAGVAEQLVGTDPARARTAVREIGATGRRSLAEMRQLIAALRDDEAGPDDALPRDPMPTLAQLPALVARVEAAGLPVTLTVHGEPGAVPPGLELATYRVVQEALTNCLKHAGASRAAVDLVHEPDLVRVTVVDDGRGVAAPGTGATGQGLVGMRERVAVYGGQPTAGPAPGGGFRVDATFPVAQP
jgi:signal transduction histidine kinase